MSGFNEVNFSLIEEFFSWIKVAFVN